MAKLTKKDLMKKINEKITDEDLATELIEDVEDSFEGTDTADLEKQIEDLKTQNGELKQKYKDRFLKGDETIKTNTNETKVETDGEEIPPQPRKFEDLFDEKGELK